MPFLPPVAFRLNVLSPQQSKTGHHLDHVELLYPIRGPSMAGLVTGGLVHELCKALGAFLSVFVSVCLSRTHQKKLSNQPVDASLESYEQTPTDAAYEKA